MNRKLILFALMMVLMVAVPMVSRAQYVEPPADAKEAFFNAVSTGDMKSLEPLLAEYPSLVWVKRDYDGKTGLHLAVMVGKYDVAKLLLAKGADPNARDNHRRTALYYAWKTPYPRFVALLVRNGGRF